MTLATPIEKYLPATPPKDGVRELQPGSGPVELRAAADDGSTLFGHFAVFNRWTEIDSWFEGNFMERIAPGAFKKTFTEQRSSMRVLLQHGRDPQIGDKPIAAISELREDETGAYYEASLFGGLDELTVNGLRAGQYGASFRFSVMREEFVKEPPRSEHNPKGLPERTLVELRVPEFGPVTFPAYGDASAGLRSGMRSLTLDFMSRDQKVDAMRDITEQLDKLEAGASTLSVRLVGLRGLVLADLNGGDEGAPKDEAPEAPEDGVEQEEARAPDEESTPATDKTKDATPGHRSTSPTTAPWDNPPRKTRSGNPWDLPSPGV